MFLYSIKQMFNLLGIGSILNVPVFKQGSRANPVNYGPMSLASVVWKLLEILWGRTYLHLEENGIIWDSQHGFVYGRTCLTNSIEICDEVIGG